MTKKSIDELTQLVVNYPLDSIILHRDVEIGRVTGYRRALGRGPLHIILDIYRHKRNTYGQEYTIDPKWKHYTVKSI